MRDDVIGAAATGEGATPPKYAKRIGSTVYKVTVHFSRTSSETIEDKLFRLIAGGERESAGTDTRREGNRSPERRKL